MSEKRTPAELCKQALQTANDAQTIVSALRAVTMALVGIAGEVNQLGKRTVLASGGQIQPPAEPDPIQSLLSGLTKSGFAVAVYDEDDDSLPG